MTAALIGLLALACWLLLRAAGAPHHRLRKVLSGGTGTSIRVPGIPPAGAGILARIRPPRAARDAIPMTVVVQQLAALLKGGRTPAQLWDELWFLHAGDAGPAGSPDGGAGSAAAPGADPLALLNAARAAARRGTSVAEAIRNAVPASPGAGRHGGRTAGLHPDYRVWEELAACFDVAETSGCPLADVLTRFAAQLEAETDAEAARQTALAGPKATVRLLTWLPAIGFGLGLLLGIDPVQTMLGTPAGIAALAAGLALTAAGRFWSSRLVRAAAALPP